MTEVKKGQVWLDKWGSEVVVESVDKHFVFYSFKYDNGESDTAYYTTANFEKHHDFLRNMELVTDAPKTDSREFNHYYINVSGYDYIDIYRVTDLYGCTSAEHHAIKKIACGGKRGAKDKIKDLREAIASLERQIEMLEEDSGER